MKITKLAHACLILEEQGKKLVIDPGTFLQIKFNDLTDVAGIVVTHVHADHLDEGRIEEIMANNPEAQIFSTQEVADQLKDKKVNVVTGSSNATVGPFNLEFFGGQHAVIHNSFPTNQNVGVLVNKNLYYPGDSFTVPSGIGVNVLAIPTSAPWLKIGESIDFLTAVKPKRVFPTHNGLNSEIAEGMIDGMLGGVAKSQGSDYHYLAIDDSIEV
jgi:L-ascorbate metabolism protein UlaG (beta-lactamase superfamily)